MTWPNMEAETKKWYAWGIILPLIVAIYLLIYLLFPQLFPGFISTYVVRPVLWCLLAGVVLLLSRYRGGTKLNFTRSLLWIALLIGVFQVALSVIGGLFLGFGKSPYQFTPPMIAINFAYMASALIGIELSRAYLIRTFEHRSTALVLGLTMLLYTVIMIPPLKFTTLNSPLLLITFLGATCLPLLAMNLLAAFLALLGGPVACIAYVGVLQLFEWFSPILPDLPWLATAFIGTIAPAIGFLVVQSRFLARFRPSEAQVETKKRGSSVVGWLAVTIIVVVIIWFSVGLLGFSPTIVGSGSMSPEMKVGDIAIAREISPDTIREGDIIKYEREGVVTMHRVIEIQQEGGSKQFITRGDANDSPDPEPVRPEEIRGRVVFVVPKLGWVAIGIKQLFTG